ncbi:Transposase [Phytophthora megakarya]|uniref:Transposase n=1 Tax=Phytophthora megakarya TaxID=4795 RepID=A0A225W7Z8_9STRA|nr:Transposase [Phytophthora megakarya]
MVTIVTDGWTDINGLAVINYVAVSGKKTYFLESVYTGCQGHDAAYLVSDLKRVIAKYKFLKVGGVVTDNTATNKSVWEQMQPDFPHVFFHGCVCHALHLLVKDTVAKVKWLDALQAACKILVGFFKTNHKLWYQIRMKLKSMGLKMLALPGDTRWGSILSCLDSVLKAEEVLFALVSSRNFLKAKSKKNRQTRRIVFNTVTATDFVPKLKRAVALLKMFGGPLERFEKDETSISDVYQIFLDLPSEVVKCGLPAKDVKVVKQLIAERFDFIYGDAHGVGHLLDPRYCGAQMVKVVKQLIAERFDFIYSDAHGVGHLLDPRYCGAQMDTETRTKVEEFIVSWHGAAEESADTVVLELVKFHRFAPELDSKSSRTWALLKNTKLSVYDFWCSLNQFPLLQIIAKQVFRCASGSSAAERNFSSHAFVHSKLRNRLAPERVEKLVHIYFNARNVDDEDLEAYTELDDILRLVDEDDEDESDNRDGDFARCHRSHDGKKMPGHEAEDWMDPFGGNDYSTKRLTLPVATRKILILRLNDVEAACLQQDERGTMETNTNSKDFGQNVAWLPGTDLGTKEKHPLAGSCHFGSISRRVVDVEMCAQGAQADAVDVLMLMSKGWVGF